MSGRRPGAADEEAAREARGRRAFEETVSLRAELDAALPVPSGEYLRSLAAQGMQPGKMVRLIHEATGGAVQLGGSRLGKLLVAEAWANGELVTPKKMVRLEALAAEADAQRLGSPSPGRTAWVSTTHLRDAAIAELGRPAFETAVAGFVRTHAEPATVLSWLRRVVGAGASIDEPLAQEVLVAHVWASAVRAGHVGDEEARALVAAQKPQRRGRRLKDSAAAARKQHPTPGRTAEVIATSAPEKPRTTKPSTAAGKRREPRALADERRLDAVLGRSAGEFILKHMRIAMSQGMSESEAARQVTASLIVRGAPKNLSASSILKIAARNGWEPEAARRAARIKVRRSEEKRSRQTSRSVSQAATGDSSGSVWDRLARTSHARFVGGGLPGLGKRR